MYIHSNYDVVAKKQLVGVLPRVGVLHHFILDFLNLLHHLPKEIYNSTQICRFCFFEVEN